MDFKKATTLFNDPDFDGEPVVIYEPVDDDDPVPPDDDGGADEDGDEDNGESSLTPKIVVSGVPVRIISERVEYVGPDGNLITKSYRDFAKKQVNAEFASLNDFVRRWNKSDRKRAIIDEWSNMALFLKISLRKSVRTLTPST